MNTSLAVVNFRFLFFIQVSCFRKSLKEYFPNSVISDRDLVYSLNFLKGILRFDAGSRPEISEVIEHPIINDDKFGGNLLEVDDIWTWKTDPASKTSKYSYFKNKNVQMKKLLKKKKKTKVFNEKNL